MSALLDVALIVVLLAYLAAGYRRGFVHSVGSIVGIVGGCVAAILLMPLVAPLIPDTTLRVIGVLVGSVVLVLIGHAIGAGIGSFFGRGVHRTPLGVLDRLLGAVVSVVVAALAVSALAAGVQAMGVPALAQPIASSRVLRTIQAVTPAPIAAAIAQLRSVVASSGLPAIDEALGQAAADTQVPSVATGSAALTAASQSVVQITGTAFACGQDQKGTGFVVAHDRVLTNAHVLAGVTAPVVLDHDGAAFVGSVVAFDPDLDLALIAVPGLDAKPLPLSRSVSAGTVGVIQGYPYGGPFTANGARVIQVGAARIANVQGGGTTSRQVATLAAGVEQGDSGGPLLSTTGRVLGIVFAKSATTADIGYAMTTDQFQALAARAPTLDMPVSSGSCDKA